MLNQYARGEMLIYSHKDTKGSMAGASRCDSRVARIRIKLRVTGHQKLVSIRYFLFFIHAASLFERSLNDLQAVPQRDGIPP